MARNTPALSMEDKMAAGMFGRARNYGWDGPFISYVITAKPTLFSNNINRTFRFRDSKMLELSSVTTLPLECTHREFSSEWLNLKISFDLERKRKRTLQ